jgi:hypothetical protein
MSFQDWTVFQLGPRARRWIYGACLERYERFVLVVSRVHDDL